MIFSPPSSVCDDNEVYREKTNILINTLSFTTAYKPSATPHDIFCAIFILLCVIYVYHILKKRDWWAFCLPVGCIGRWSIELKVFENIEAMLIAFLPGFYSASGWVSQSRQICGTSYFRVLFLRRSFCHNCASCLSSIL